MRVLREKVMVAVDSAYLKNNKKLKFAESLKYVCVNYQRYLSLEAAVLNSCLHRESNILEILVSVLIENDEK